METTDYLKQATDFLEKHSIGFAAEYIRTCKYFADDKYERDIYRITFKRDRRTFSLEFGQSINDSMIKVVNKNSGRVTKTITERRPEWFKDGKLSENRFGMWFGLNHFILTSVDEIIAPKAPTPYDVLACLRKYPVGEFEDFCSELGYDTDSRKALKTYEAVCAEWIKVNNFFTGGEIEEMQEIR